MRALKFDDTGLFLLAGSMLSVVYQHVKIGSDIKMPRVIQSEWPFGHSHISFLAFLSFPFFFQFLWILLMMFVLHS